MWIGRVFALAIETRQKSIEILNNEREYSVTSLGIIELFNSRFDFLFNVFIILSKVKRLKG